MLGNTLKIALATEMGLLQSSSLHVLPVLGSHMLHQIELLRSFEFTNETREERLVKMMLEMHIQSSFGLKNLLTFGTLFLVILGRNMLGQMFYESNLVGRLKVAFLTSEHFPYSVGFEQMKF